MFTTMRRLCRRVVIIAAVFGTLYLGLRLSVHWYMSWKSPYGWSHCCDACLGIALEEYASDHNGADPTGESCPEASLSLLYPKYVDANVLRGKTVPLETVQALLESGKKLGPKTCGWHYVEGLRFGDDPDLALFWDKVGLGHNGARNPDGGHCVWFLDRGRDYVSGAEWPSFLAEQERLLAVTLKKRQKPPQKRSRDGGPAPIRA